MIRRPRTFNTPRDMYVFMEGTERSSLFHNIPQNAIRRAWKLAPGAVKKTWTRREPTFRTNVTRDEFELRRDPSGEFHSIRPLWYNDHKGLLTNSIVVFPREEHISDFRDASKDTDRYGPSDSNPVAVGTLTIRKYQNSPGHGLYESPLTGVVDADPGRVRILQNVQAHFKKRQGEQTAANHPIHREGWGTPLPAKVRERYMGWRQVAIAHMVDALKAEGSTLLVQEHNLKDPRTGKATPFASELKSYCKKQGIKTRLVRGQLVITP